MSAAAAAIPAEAMEDLQRAQQLRSQSLALSQRLGELRLQAGEHERVIQVLQKVSGERTCYRLTGQVLVERQVDSVVQELEQIKSQIQRAIEGGLAQKESFDKEAQTLLQPHSSVLEELGRQELAQR